MRIDGWRRRREGLIAAQADPHLALEMRVHGLRVSLKSTDRQHKNHEGEGNLAKALKSNEDHQAKSGTHPCTEQPVASSDDTSDNKEVAYTPTEFGLGWGAWRNCLFSHPPPPMTYSGGSSCMRRSRRILSTCGATKQKTDNLYLFTR